MSVNTPDRRLSKREFDRVYFRIHDDAVFLTSNAFGADERHKKDTQTHKTNISLANHIQDENNYI